MAMMPRKIAEMRRITFATLVLAIFLAVLFLSACGDEKSGGNTDDCLADCQCQLDNVCLPACQQWAQGAAILQDGCSSDCYNYSSCYPKCEEQCYADGESDWNGSCSFDSGNIDWAGLRASCD